MTTNTLQKHRPTERRPASLYLFGTPTKTGSLTTHRLEKPLYIHELSGIRIVSEREEMLRGPYRLNLHTTPQGRVDTDLIYSSDLTALKYEEGQDIQGKAVVRGQFIGTDSGLIHLRVQERDIFLGAKESIVWPEHTQPGDTLTIDANYLTSGDLVAYCITNSTPAYTLRNTPLQPWHRHGNNTYTRSRPGFNVTDPNGYVAKVYMDVTIYPNTNIVPAEQERYRCDTRGEGRQIADRRLLELGALL